MADEHAEEPDSTAIRVALWRALHVLIDSSPHVIEDDLGLKLAAPGEDWRRRPDMDPQITRGFRTSIVARARFIEDHVVEQVGRGVDQYVVLGAGLDTFAQRRPEVASALRIFEVDRPATQAWKRRRLTELGFGIPAWLRFVPVDFEAGLPWWDQLTAAGFDTARPAVVASAGVSLYISKDATAADLRYIAGLAPGSTLAITFILPVELLDPEDRAGVAASKSGAQSSGTPFVSFYAPAEMLALAGKAGFKTVEHISGRTLAERYFAGRSDGLRPSSGEDILVAGT
jgi:methyltransferase (TIGR00027 family)